MRSTFANANISMALINSMLRDPEARRALWRLVLASSLLSSAWTESHQRQPYVRTLTAFCVRLVTVLDDNIIAATNAPVNEAYDAENESMTNYFQPLFMALQIFADDTRVQSRYT